MTASLPDRLRKAADELDSLRCAEDAALMREAAEALDAPHVPTEPVYRAFAVRDQVRLRP